MWYCYHEENNDYEAIVGHAENKRERIEQVEALLQFALDGVTIFDIAKHVGCDPSTAHRYLKEIEQRRQLIPMDRGRYRLDPSQSLHNVSLYPTEALSIFLALRRYIRQTSKAPLFMLSAIQKIVPALQRPDLVFNLIDPQRVLKLWGWRPVEAELPRDFNLIDPQRVLKGGHRQNRTGGGHKLQL